MVGFEGTKTEEQFCEIPEKKAGSEAGHSVVALLEKAEIYVE